VPPASTPSSWKVTPRGIGALEAGMSPTQVSAIVHFATALPRDDTWKDCGYVTFAELPAGVRVMVEQGTIARVEVRDSSISTTEGARVGDTEARIKQLYGNRIEVQPHKYTSGHYLIARSAQPADSAFRLVFETDGMVVTAYRAGRRPPVEYVEGCS
jgi:hypothetical protein